ncbi:hypothetical protein SDRG_03898 [Saprolegnia diclina VS20]|uniref:EF-hand domain-containing protein n=1 Tax=Saprolegnia diclina (strain VS20) TaxID=1156394 RepID=T0S1P1_SAPDV|nr:hypothetical protein SDRG_03898 [Saprolegnia diclina VS20]EQC38943.1 hypothetical protein SDRG_03898 [Saprolegnia diclina VS20]|eukprot:XP_008607767.1 hypothetical protein SDRG_03898 [Saprolegnia diclina VS20]
MQARASVVTADVVQAASEATPGLSLPASVQLWKCLVDGLCDHVHRRVPIRLERLLQFEPPSTFVDVAFAKTPVRLAPTLNLAHAARIQRLDEHCVEAFLDVIRRVLTDAMARGEDIRLGFLPLGEWLCTQGRVSFVFQKQSLAMTPSRGGWSSSRASEPMYGRPTSNQSRHDDRPATASTRASTVSKAMYGRPASNQSTHSLRPVTASSSVAGGARLKSERAYSAHPTSNQSNHDKRPGTAQTQKRLAPSRGSIPSGGRASMVSRPASNQVPPTRLGTARPSTGSTHRSSTSRVLTAASRPPTAASRALTSVSRNQAPSTPLHTSKSRGSQASMRSKNESSAPDALLAHVKAVLLQRSGDHAGIHTLSRTMRALDANRDGRLSRDELQFGLRDFGVDCSPAEVDAIMSALDRDGDGSISFDEFLLALRGPIAPARLAMISLAFQKLDVNGDGVVTLDDVRELYDTTKHPAFISGEKAADDILSEFMAQWDTDEKDGVITLAEFEHYYQNVSASIDDDAYFELMIRNAWRISGGVGWCANSANKRVLHEDADGNQRVVEATLTPRRAHEEKHTDAFATRLQDPLAYVKHTLFDPPCTVDGLAHRLGANRVLGSGQERVHLKAFATALSKRDKMLSSRDALVIARAMDDSGSQVIDIPALHARFTSRFGAPPRATGVLAGNVLDRLKAKIVARGGAAGIHAVQRVMRIWDDGGDGKLTKNELKSGLETYGIEIHLHDIDQLMTLLDTDHSGTISFDELLTGLRGELNDRRRALIHQAYSVLDVDGDGQVTIDDLRKGFDVTHHPDVVAGRLTPRDALVQFMQHWDLDGDGTVSLAEFETYYRGISASIDGDDYFELMMRNAWHLSGGTGACANSSNRRVLVTHADGHQTIEEIKNDIRVRSRQGMLDNLAAQHVHATSMTTKGSALDLRSKKLSNHVPTRSAREDAHAATLAERHAAAMRIQRRFRCFRAQKFVRTVRRKMVAARMQVHQTARDHAKAKPSILRPALRTYHGF